LSQARSDRLLVLNKEGNLFTIKPDGSARLDLTTDANRQHIYAQPTWSPTGERIAWAEITGATGEMTGSLVTSLADGTQRTRAEAPFPPFYLYWSPNGQQVAYLSNWVAHNERTIALRVVDVRAGGQEAHTLNVGRPFYFSWSPDSTQLLTHIGNQRVGLLALDGTETILAEESANFATPQWSSDGASLLYGIQAAGVPQLVVANPTGEVQSVVTIFKGQTGAAFSLSPNGKQIAYTETDAPVGVNSYGPLFIFDVEREEFEQITPDSVLAFFWNPAGDTLLVFTAEFNRELPWVRLAVWDGAELRTLSRFVPSNVLFNQYLPFADQYAQNLRFWSPNGNAVVYSGWGESGKDGIWVHRLDEQEPVRISDGVFATWSPQ
jgi:TolB protein